ncbi:ArsR/SmtB family transcription factor [Clavibacter michiganensis]|uniref:Transcriptional regulator, ArsR family n=1 Tax=Clavibacter michiganensis subsp. michiganensis (strain NCPPB 382) TaxID=443906 RepID=A5CND5_CLAM3|nr:metalloregulator ArsR/SmtB family transcription factor [Clavibacter michiganensis]MBF4637605.1 winged helix-turn-helix transcriptional regulator [Clavibacter michiganensis subsp. michiganensis]MDO4031719.1 metalloregulator ArsR/SmtB family transcription factor [Clavibacter michiganensis]MDO4081077.1 metalloregulator ArsR/SmtB family transcription factor [Clavibacter michiganensis]MDO4088946.1 metalloregulator ArsR/SmtB family transcription factor [Clavibacter michiganensis]MDO4096951.1 meta
MADIFDVVADPTRRDLLRVLLDRRAVPEAPTGEISVSELVQTLGISQPTVSKHLRVLRDSGLVSVREEGQHRYYRLEPAPLEALDAWVAPFVDDGQDDAGPDGGHADPETGLLGGGLSADPDGEDDGDPSGYPFAASLGRIWADTRYQAAAAVHDATRVAGSAGQASLGRLRARKQGNSRDA